MYDNSYFTDDAKLLGAGVFPHYLGMSIKHMEGTVSIFEPRREKTGLRDFRPGPTQTGLYKLRKELEA